eukprot:TRINITY_DN83639_c0_g1_i1.p3 TRINITY_DN83639_c0_g1~~TRINITY_DN83639_c0_g1_i1.p3  ORF type:complete len:103 (+),score=7.75 TRINITY_DN83639_c0_g1_i1:2-310(+)
MNYWYPCFIENFNLWKYVMNGWTGEGQCYFTTPDVPCNGPFQDERGDIQQSQGTDGVHKKHYGHAASEFEEYYTNITIARQVTEIYLNDIAGYNYSYWTEFL